MKLDERFLTVHPRTKLWWTQREQCAQCKHVRHIDMKQTRGGWGQSGGQWSCAQNKGGGHANGFRSCIDAREEGGACGPEARLFEDATCTETTASAS